MSILAGLILVVLLGVHVNGSYKLLGYYKDTSNRAMRYGPKQYGYTVESCAQSCSAYKYFALQDNGWCVCDNDWEHSTKYGKSDINCGASGGVWCNTIYAVNPSVYSLLGSFKDTLDRALRTSKGSGYNVESCAQACKGYSFFSLQYYGECYCDNDLSHSVKYGSDNNCTPLGTAWCNALYSFNNCIQGNKDETKPNVNIDTTYTDTDGITDEIKADLNNNNNNKGYIIFVIGVAIFIFGLFIGVLINQYQHNKTVKLIMESSKSVANHTKHDIIADGNTKNDTV